MGKKKIQRNFDTSKEAEERLIYLRNYYSYTYNNIYDMAIEEMYKRVTEKKNEDLMEKLNTQYVEVDHKIQQLTLMLRAYKKDLDGLKIEVKEGLGEVNQQGKKLKEENEKNYTRIVELRNTKQDKISKLLGR